MILGAAQNTHIDISKHICNKITRKPTSTFGNQHIASSGILIVSATTFQIYA